MNISFVTGANGFVGSHLVEYLLSQGHEVHCLMRKSSDDKWLKGLNITIHRGGIENVEFLRAAFTQYKANYIFHIAGTVKAFDYAGFEAGNVKPTRCILDAALGIDSIKKIIVTSSIAASQQTVIGKPNDENCPRSPLTDYGMSKVAEEDLAKSYMDRLPIAIVRPPIVYGERDTEVLLFFKTIKSHILPMIGFSPKAVSLVHVSDLVRGIAMCGLSDNSKNNTYFISGHKEENGWKEMGDIASKILDTWTISLRVPHFLIFIIAYTYEFIAKLFGIATTFNSQKYREMVSEAWTCTSNKAKIDFGYIPEMSLERGFEQTISWYKEHRWI